MASSQRIATSARGRFVLLLPWLGTAALVLGLAQPRYWWDEWDLADWWLRVRASGLDPQALWMQHNEHRPVLGRLLFYLSAECGASPMVLTFVSLAFIGATLGLLWPLVRGSSESLAATWRIPYQLALAAFFLSWVQWENLTMGMQVGFSGALLGVVLAARGLAALPGRRAYGQVIGGGALAYLSSAHWLILAPLVLGWCAWRLWSRRRLGPGRRLVWVGVLATVVLAAMLSLYLEGLTRPPQHPRPTYAVEHPVKTLGFVQLYYGNPFASGSPPLPRAMGTLFAIGSLLLLGLAARRKVWSSEPELATLTVLCLVGTHASALLVAAGRAGLGPEAALSSRYASSMLVGWLVFLCSALRWICGERERNTVGVPGWGAMTLAGVVVGLPLGLGLGISAAKLYQVATWTMPARAAGGVCLEDVLADPSRLPSRRACLEALYPDADRLLGIARQLPR